MSWTAFAGVVLLLYAAFVVYRGKIRSGDDYGGSWTISREKSPVRFWIYVGVMLAIAFTLIFNLLHM